MGPDRRADVGDPRRHPYRWVLFGGVCAVYFAFGVVAMSVPPLVGEVRDDLGLSRSAMGLALGAYLVSQAFAAVCIAALALSLIHMNTASGEWISAIAYPAVAAIAALALIGISAQRFRARIAETHAARWQHRKAPH